jgi:hypothetical protein
MPVVACDKCVVTTGLFILLQATGHGLDPLPGVIDLDIFDWSKDHARLRRLTKKTQNHLGIGGSNFRKRLVRCSDSFAQRACLNRALNEPWVGIVYRRCSKKYKGATPAKQPRVAANGASMLRMGGGGGSFAEGFGFQQPMGGCDHVFGLSDEDDFGLGAHDSSCDGFLDSFLALDEPGAAEAAEPSPGFSVGEIDRCSPHELGAGAGVAVHSFAVHAHVKVEGNSAGQGYETSEAVGVVTKLWPNGDYSYLPTVASGSVRRSRRVVASRVSAYVPSAPPSMPQNVNLMRGMFETAGQRRVEERNYALAREAKAGEDLAESHRTAQLAESRAVEEERRRKVAEAEAAAEKRAAAVARKAAAQAQQSCADKLAAAQARATAAVIEITNGAESAQREKIAEATAYLLLGKVRLEQKAVRQQKAHARALEKMKLDYAARTAAQTARLLTHAYGEQTRLHVDLAEEHAAENEALVQAHAIAMDDIKVAHSAKLAAVEAVVCGLKVKAKSVDGLAQLLLSPENAAAVKRIPSVNSFGAHDHTVADMNPRRQTDMGKIAGLFIDAILGTLKAGAPDPLGVARAMTNRRNRGSAAVARILAGPNDDADEELDITLLRVLADSYKAAARTGNKTVMRQQLSVAVSVGGVTSNEILKAFSEKPDLEPGDHVYAIIAGNVTRPATVVTVLEEKDMVELTGLGLICASKVWKIGSVRCPLHQIHEAKLHAKSRYPGAEVPATVNAHWGLEPDRAAFVAIFLRSPTVVEVVEASLANSRQNAAKGVKYRLKQRRWVLHQRLVKDMVAANLKPASWGYFSMLTSDKSQYELLTVDNCCCGICRELGFENYDELREIVDVLDAALMRGLASKKSLQVRINKEEEFRRGLFMTHLTPESECACHCMTMLLSSHTDSRFRKACDHGGEGTGTAPKSMKQMVSEEYHRMPQPADWNDACEVCDGNESGNVFLCTHCAAVAHKCCIEREHWDLPQGADDECPRAPRAPHHQKPGRHHQASATKYRAQASARKKRSPERIRQGHSRAAPRKTEIDVFSVLIRPINCLLC